MTEVETWADSDRQDLMSARAYHRQGHSNQPDLASTSPPPRLHIQYLSTAKSYFQQGSAKNSKSTTLRDAPDRPNMVWTRKDQLGRRQDSQKEVESELARERARERIREWRQQADRVVDADRRVLSDSASEISRKEGLERRLHVEETTDLRRQVSIACCLGAVAA